MDDLVEHGITLSQWTPRDLPVDEHLPCLFVKYSPYVQECFIDWHFVAYHIKGPDKFGLFGLFELGGGVLNHLLTPTGSVVDLAKGTFLPLRLVDLRAGLPLDIVVLGGVGEGAAIGVLPVSTLAFLGRFCGFPK